MTDPQSARRAYKAHAAEAGRLLHATEDARLRLAESEEERTAAYASVEEDLARLDEAERRAAGIWKELTTRFGPGTAGPLPDPAEHAEPPYDVERLLAGAHRQVREPIDHPVAGRYFQMAVLGFAATAVLALVGMGLASLLHDLGRVRLLALYGPVIGGPWIGRLAATTWIRTRTSHEEREYAVDTAVGGTVGGGAVWAIALVLVIVRAVT